MKEKLISVIVPVYNVEQYLNECVDSILRQTYRELEIILVNDGSTDNSGAICDEYARKDSRIKVVHKENGGLSSARNYGLDRMQGDYVAFVDSDDYIADTMYEELMKKSLQYDADITACGFTRFYEDGKEEEDCNFYDGEFFTEKDFGTIVNYGDYKVQMVIAWNKLYKRHVFESVRYPVEKLHEDEFVFFDVFEKAKNFVFLRKTLYKYRQRELSIMSTMNIDRLDLIEATLIQCEKILKRKDYISAKKQFDLTLRLYQHIIQRVEIKADSAKKKVMKTKKHFYKTLKKFGQKMFSLKERVALTLYFLSPKIKK